MCQISYGIPNWCVCQCRSWKYTRTFSNGVVGRNFQVKPRALEVLSRRIGPCSATISGSLKGCLMSQTQSHLLVDCTSSPSHRCAPPPSATVVSLFSSFSFLTEEEQVEEYWSFHPFYSRRLGKCREMRIVIIISWTLSVLIFVLCHDMHDMWGLCYDSPRPPTQALLVGLVRTGGLLS